MYKNKSTFGGLRELNKLRAKAKRFKKQGINEDGSKILLSDVEHLNRVENLALVSVQTFISVSLLD
mgnify:CR=1 FL=1